MSAHGSPISNAPFEELRVGDQVFSEVTGRHGIIVNLVNQEFACQQEDNEVHIRWESGSLSNIWHFWCDKVLFK